MNKIIIKINNDYDNLLREFSQWYKAKGYNRTIAIDKFIKLDNIFILPLFKEYIIDKHNIGFNFDSDAIISYYYIPQLNAKDIMDNWKESNKFEYSIIKEYNMKELIYIEAYERALFIVLDSLYVNNNKVSF